MGYAGGQAECRCVCGVSCLITSRMPSQHTTVPSTAVLLFTNKVMPSSESNSKGRRLWDLCVVASIFKIVESLSQLAMPAYATIPSVPALDLRVTLAITVVDISGAMNTQVMAACATRVGMVFYEKEKQI